MADLSLHVGINSLNLNSTTMKPDLNGVVDSTYLASIDILPMEKLPHLNVHSKHFGSNVVLCYFVFLSLVQLESK